MSDPKKYEVRQETECCWVIDDPEGNEYSHHFYYQEQAEDLAEALNMAREERANKQQDEQQP